MGEESGDAVRARVRPEARVRAGPHNAHPSVRVRLAEEVSRGVKADDANRPSANLRDDALDKGIETFLLDALEVGGVAVAYTGPGLAASTGVTSLAAPGRRAWARPPRHLRGIARQEIERGCPRTNFGVAEGQP